MRVIIVILGSRKNVVWVFSGGVQKVLSTYLMNIYNNRKFTFKLTIEFSFLLINVDDSNFQEYVKNPYIYVNFDLHYASTNTRPKGLKIQLL